MGVEASGGGDVSKGSENIDSLHPPQPGSDELAKHVRGEHHASVTIIARVHNHSIALPADLEVPEGAEVQITLPDPVAAGVNDNPMAWMQEFVGALDSLPVDAAERHNELAHGRKRRRS